MDRGILCRQEGFTIIEVLVSAIVFMIGFSILVFMLNQAITRYSIGDITRANNIGKSVMENSFASRDTITLDTIIVVSQVSYRLQKEVRLEDNLAAVTITVGRERLDKELCRLYGEYAIR
jgi:type II secretory pathway component PulJ